MTEADDNLRKIDHIVVLMMENRSFDHMLGFLTIEQGREDIEGPTLAMKNDYGGGAFPGPPPARATMTKVQGPRPSGWGGGEELANNSGGAGSQLLKNP